jgi:hypothetical protein
MIGLQYFPNLQGEGGGECFRIDIMIQKKVRRIDR